MNNRLFTLILFLTSCFNGFCNGEDIFSISTVKGLIYVDTVKINNSLLLDEVIIDTGAEITVIDKSVFSGQNGTKVTVSDIAGAKTMLRKIKLDSLIIGENRFYNIDCVVTDLDNQIAGLKGIIGGNVLKTKVWNFDFINGIAYCSNKVNETKYKHQIRLQISKNAPYADLTIGNLVLKNVLIDTGNKNRLTLSKKYSDKISSDAIIEKNYYRTLVNSLNNSADREIVTEELLLSKIYLNNILAIDSCYAIYFGKNETVGFKVIEKLGNIAFDYLNKKLYFNYDYVNMQPNQNFDFGFRIREKQSGEFIVYQIQKNTVAEKAGIQLNDKVIGINNGDFNLNQKNLNSELTNYLSDKEEVSVQIERNGQTVNILLNKKAI